MNDHNNNLKDFCIINDNHEIIIIEYPEVETEKNIKSLFDSNEKKDNIPNMYSITMVSLGFSIIFYTTLKFCYLFTITASKYF
jgi:hypothetical protein